MKKSMLKTIAVMTAAACAISTVVHAAPAGSQLPADLWEFTEVWDEADNLTYEFREVSVTIPADWSGKYDLITGENYVTFYHPASRDGWTESLDNDIPSGGHLFTIALYQDYKFYDLPDFEIAGSGEYGIYVSILPSDVQGYSLDADIWNEWTTLTDDLEEIRASITVTNPGEGIVNTENLTFTDQGTSSDEESTFTDSADSGYILEDSSDRYLTPDDLEGMNADEIQMAINEIYARHHRRFVTKSIQEYFDSKSWYEGTVEASRFDETSLNQYEGRNIWLMIQYMNDLPQASGTGTQSDAASAVSSYIASGSALYATATVNIRSSASTNGVIMGIVPQGYAVTVTGSPSGGWVPVNYNGIRGYVSQDYLADADTVSIKANDSQLLADGTASTNTSANTNASASSQDSSVCAAVQLYAGAYRDNSVFIPENGWNDYYSLVVSNITDTSFDFTIYRMDCNDSIKETMFATNTAVFTGDGTTAFYDGQQYDLTFTFPDYHLSLPDVTDIQVSGFWATEGITFANNHVPGHEFC